MNPARANIKQALGYLKDGDGDGNSQFLSVKASANSDVMYFVTSAQDGYPSQDDVRLCLGDDLKKAQDHMSLLPTFKACKGSLIVRSSRTPSIPCQMANPLTVRARYSAWAIVVKLALVAQW
ncbi:hypothetical protein Tco_0778071 [Tanacetum coccineum]